MKDLKLFFHGSIRSIDRSKFTACSHLNTNLDKILRYCNVIATGTREMRYKWKRGNLLHHIIVDQPRYEFPLQTENLAIQLQFILNRWSRQNAHQMAKKLVLFSSRPFTRRD